MSGRPQNRPLYVDRKLYPTRQRKTSLIHEAKRTHPRAADPPAHPRPSQAHTVAANRTRSHRFQNPFHRAIVAPLQPIEAPPPYARACVWRSSRAHSSTAARGPGTHSPLSARASPGPGDAKRARASANAGRVERSRTTDPARSAMHEAAPVSVSPRAPPLTRSEKQRSDAADIRTRGF